MYNLLNSKCSLEDEVVSRLETLVSSKIYLKLLVLLAN